MTDIEAFKSFTIKPSPSTTLYRNGSYRSDKEYLDASGKRWVYVGLCDGDPLWRRESEQAMWVINAVVDQFGPLTEVSVSDAARDAQILRAASSDSDEWDNDTWAAWFRTAERAHGTPDGEAPSLFRRVGALKARVAELEKAPLSWARALDPSDLHMLMSDLSAALLGYWHDDPDTVVLARVEAVLAEHREQAEEAQAAS